MKASAQDFSRIRLEMAVAPAAPRIAAATAAFIGLDLVLRWVSDTESGRNVFILGGVAIVAMLVLATLLQIVTASGSMRLTSVVGWVSVTVLSTYVVAAVHLSDLSAIYSLPYVILIVMMSLPFWLDHVSMVIGFGCSVAPLAITVANVGIGGDALAFIRLAIVSLAIIGMLYWVIWRSNFRMYLLGQEIEYRAYHDSLTGLHNRSRWYELANESHALAARAIKPCSLLYLDIDRFKTINDRFGHDTGDQVLQAVTRVLVNDTRESDVLARFGGEEFVVLLPGVDLAGAIACAQRLHQSMTTIDMLPQQVTISIGVAEALPIETLEQMINRADRALLQAKETGRNRTVIATGDTFSSLSAHATPHYAFDHATTLETPGPFSVIFPRNDD